MHDAGIVGVVQGVGKLGAQLGPLRWNGSCWPGSQSARFTPCTKSLTMYT